MATVTPNFNFPVPQSTDLVKDGATAIAALGTAIDTDFVDLKGGTTGQVLSKASGTDLDFTWIAQDDSNAIQNAIVDAKGDLIAASAADTPARLAVGNNGETLVADSSTSTGLRWQVSQAAGKNYLINGGFDIWQRGTSYALPATTINYGAADRWCYYSNAVTGRTASRQTASLAGFTYSQRIQRDSGNTNTQSTQLVQLIESSVATSLQGQYVTVSFWAKAGANYSVASSNITVVLYAGTGTDQNPYTTGYTGQTTPISTSQAITTSWAKYSFTTSAALASTITELTLAIQSGAFVGTAGANDWFEVTGVQLEAGQTGTLFTRAGGTIQGELAACQRYFFKTSGNSNYSILATGMCASTTVAIGFFSFPVTMRTSPSSFDNSSLYVEDSGGGAGTSSTVTYSNQTTNTVRMNITGLTGITAHRPCHIFTNNNSSGYISASAEL